MSPDWLLNAANVLFLGSFSVRDILWLRVLSVLGGFCLIGFFAVSEPPNLTGIAWNSLFGVLNGYHIVRLLLERRPVHLDEREIELHQLAFRSLTPRELRRLAAVGQWHAVDAETLLCDQGEALDRLIMLMGGRAVVEVAGRQVAELEPGRFVGEMSFLTDEPTSAGVRASEPLRYVSWGHAELKSFLAGQPELKAAIQRILGMDLARKLRSAA